MLLGKLEGFGRRKLEAGHRHIAFLEVRSGNLRQGGRAQPHKNHVLMVVQPVHQLNLLTNPDTKLRLSRSRSWHMITCHPGHFTTQGLQ